MMPWRMPQSLLVNAKIGDNDIINASEITDSEVKNDCKIGPYTHLRMNTLIEDKNRIGNFVEFKNTHFGLDSRCAHLTYLGDSEVGSKVNIGCGVITVNYDGKYKYHTVIKDGAFIGSNCNLIAPVTVGENAVVAAGSTANHDVPDGSMEIAKVTQKGQITVPVDVLKRLNVKAGDKILFVEEAGRIYIMETGIGM